MVFETALRVYSTQGFSVFEQKFPVGCTNCSGGVNDRDDVIASFPTFVHEPTAPRLNFMTWGGNQLSESTIGHWDLDAAAALRTNTTAPYPPPLTYATGCNYTYKDRCPLDYPYFGGTFVGGAEHGTPLVLYSRSTEDAPAAALVLSPLANFVVAEHALSPTMAALAGGAASIRMRHQRTAAHTAGRLCARIRAALGLWRGRDCAALGGGAAEGRGQGGSSAGPESDAPRVLERPRLVLLRAP